MSAIRLAHITDLHCVPNTAWDKNFEALTSFLSQEKPNIVVATGDCVDNPDRRSFDHLTEMVTALSKTLSTLRDDFFLITIAGNHDRYKFGNKIPTLKLPFTQKPEVLFDEYWSRLLYPPNHDLEALVRLIFDRYGLALFPIDSTNPKFPLAFAQGRVREPLREMEKWKTKFESWAGASREIYSSSIKVVLLHHHVVPLPAEGLDETLEPFNLIQNPFEFLHAATKYKIDLILHGHRHVSGVSQLEVLSHNLPPVTISACGSSCKTNLPSPREAKIIEINESGAATIIPYSSQTGVGDFVKGPGLSIFSYERQRERRNRDLNRYDPELVQVVQRINKFSKLVKTEYNNTCEINRTFSGIKWQLSAPNLEIKDRITSEAGRIVRVKTLLSGQPWDDSGVWRTRAEMTDVPADPRLPEDVEFIVKPALLIFVWARRRAGCAG